MLDRVRRWAPTSFPMPSAADLRAGLVHGLVSVPDGLATGLLAGLNPIAGLYGYLFGTLAGALTTSSALMSVQATGAMSVIVADTPGLTGPGGDRGLATLTVLTGLFMLAAGIARRRTPSSSLTSIRSAWNVRLAGFPPSRRAAAGMADRIRSTI